MGAWRRKVSGWLRRDQLAAELREELETHVAMKASATGDPRTARRDFGNVTLLVEDSRAAWGWPRLESWRRDCFYAFRVMVRKPGFACTMVITLALGIGATTTICSLTDAVLIRPLPYPNPDRLVFLEEARANDQRSHTLVSPGRLADWQNEATAFDAIAGSTTDTMTETTGQMPERLAVARVSPRFFTVLGTGAALGRVFTPEEGIAGGALAIVISDAYWKRRFSADPSVLGRPLVLGGKSYPIVGVMPPSVQYPSPRIEVWLPMQTSADMMRTREARFVETIGRLKRGVTLERAQADLLAVQRKLGERYPKTDAGWGIAIQPLKDRIVGNTSLALWMLLGAVVVLLVITCANVACLLLARLNHRSAELATRVSLGAGRGAIARQLFAEGLVYALAGGVLGATAAFAGATILRDRVPEIPRINEMAVDLRALALAAGISVATAVLFTLAPVLQTFRSNWTVALIRGGRVVGTRQRLPRLLVSAQLALATALLIGAGLLLKSLARLEEAPLGFRADAVLTLHVSASFQETPDASMARHQRTFDLLRSLPGVKAVSMSSGLPGVDPTWPREFEIMGEPTADGTARFSNWRIVTAKYFQTVGLPIVEGRSCRMNTEARRPFEALVNRRFAERYFPGREVIQHEIMGGPVGDVTTTIVGVVADAHEDGPNVAPRPTIYACGYLRYWPDSDFLIQASNPAALAGVVQPALRMIDPMRPVYAVRTLAEALDGSLSPTRFRTLLVTGFSIMALIIAAIGLYGVMAYMVSQRTREIGVRLALGARRGQIVSEILQSGGALAIGGAAAGVVLAALGSRALSSLLFGVGASDLVTYAWATGMLLVAALLACLIPTRRATSIDPTLALRE